MSVSLAMQFAAAGLDWVVPDWPAPESVRAFSTTRNGPHGGRFDLSPRAPDRAAIHAELRRWLPEEPLWLAQVHGSAVSDLDQPRGTVDASAPRADAAVAREVRRVCAVFTADCMPVLLTDRAGSVVAAAHAGWRGLAGGVLEAALAAMRVEARDVLAWLGPAIGPRAFEVGADVLEAHCAGDPEAMVCFRPFKPGKWLADLYALARRRLVRAGVTSIHGAERCTFSERDIFHSYRRDRGDTRMGTFIWRDA
jgi:YfiH family protein